MGSRLLLLSTASDFQHGFVLVFALFTHLEHAFGLLVVDVDGLLVGFRLQEHLVA